MRERIKDDRYLNITKVVSFPEPPRFEFSRDLTYKKKKKMYNIFNVDNICLNITNFHDDKRLVLFNINDYKEILNLPFTKDDYVKALDKMVDIWKLAK